MIRESIICALGASKGFMPPSNPILTAFLVGMLAAASPCVLPLYPGFLAYLGSGRGRHFSGFFILAGLLSMMLLLGGLIALASAAIGRVFTLLIPLADALILVLGVLLIFNKNPFQWLSPIQSPRSFSHPIANAYVYGLLYGPLALPCSGALVVGIFSLSFSVTDALGKLVLFICFGLGMGLPLLVLSFLAGTLQRGITRQLAVHARWVNLAAGLLLVGAGLIDGFQNWENFRLMVSILR
jgi:cytochrome c-type biogenesis protein